jgi:hypothetical protein
MSITAMIGVANASTDSAAAQKNISVSQSSHQLTVRSNVTAQSSGHWELFGPYYTPGQCDSNRYWLQRWYGVSTSGCWQWDYAGRGWYFQGWVWW